MEYQKKQFYFLLILLLNFIVYTYDELLPGELIIANKNSSDIIKVNVYPVGAVFNGHKDFKLECVHKYTGYYSHIVGGSKGNLEYEFRMFLDHDAPIDAEAPDGAIGYGKYRIDFYKWDGSEYDYVNYCYVDYGDSDYPYTGMQHDMFINYYSSDDIRWGTSINMPSDRTYKIWDQRPIGGNRKDQNKNGFKTNTNWLGFPHNALNYQGSEPWGHETPQKLFLNIEVLATHNPFVISGKTFEITSATELRVFNSTSLDVGDIYGGATMIIDTDGKLFVSESSSVTFKERSALLMWQNSRLSVLDGNNVYFKPLSVFCNKGGIIEGSTNLHFDGVIKKCDANPSTEICYFEDSVKVLLHDTSTIEIADSSTWIFQGNETALLCDSGSTIRFGKGSKLIFQDGARINAKHTKFTTYDSNTTWNGIYVNGVSYDTLQYCTIENALNGINVEDKISYFGNAPATEISNCEFSNKTSEQLLNMVYVNNSANVMIRNCTSSSLINDGFASGVIIEYSTAGGINIIDNELEHVTTGINVIQSSPYIARNTITGGGSNGTGIYLDNSNGTIEYNIVNNFDKSKVLYYSSPYILKNTFDNDNSVCAEVTAYSAPVMKPIVSGTTLRWLGGNNRFTGSPSTAGITLISEGHPLMDSGYNVINVGNSLYMQGTISRVLYMRVNNWYDNPPQSEKFDISGDEYDYSEYFDGYTIPPPDYYELNEIGFGYYDTVYVDEIGGDNPTAEDIFILAYRKEMEKKFVEAVVLYKNVISNFKTSNYAITSLSRIFNCLEKSNAGINQYSAVKSYYDGIKNSNTYPQRIREHAEDLAIKAKVRMGFIEEAISDYQTIINNNGNNPKGIHAQVNKLVLMNMNSGGDNMMIGNRQTNENYKANLLSLITGKSIQSENRFANNIPGQFKLYQNYPNPFNPKTSIKYEIPHDAQVTLKIYDITGREIVNITEFRQAGSYSYTFDGTNYASGMYLYKLESDNFTETKKMVLIK